LEKIIWWRISKMISDLYEKAGYMVGTFYSSILGYNVEVWYDKDISQEYVERNIQYLNELDQNFLVSICDALRRYYENYQEILPDLCEDISEDILKEFEKEPTTILSYISIGVYKFHKCNINDEHVPVLNLRGSCAWSGDEGVTIAAKNNCLLYVGPWTEFNVWTSTSKKMFNYAMPKDI
jgi:hypothetical protein